MTALRAGADLVMGDRFAGGIDDGAMPPLHRYVGNPALSFLGRLFFHSDIRDFHCGLRGFRRDAIVDLDLQSPGMEFASEMVVKATLGGLAHRPGADPPPPRRPIPPTPPAAPGGTAGGTCASCSSTAPAGCSSTPGLVVFVRRAWSGARC